MGGTKRSWSFRMIQYHKRNFHSSPFVNISNSPSALDSKSPADNKPGFDLFSKITSSPANPPPPTVITDTGGKVVEATEKLPVPEGLSTASTKSAVNATAVLGTAGTVEAAENVL